jgi:hypothetical protein
LDGSHDIVLTEYSNWRLIRNWPSGYIDIEHRKVDGSWTRLSLALAWRRSQIPLKAFPSADGGSLYVLTYDAVSNIPAGRSLKTTSEGLDLYRVMPESKAEPLRVATGMPLGGFDARVFVRHSADEITLCGVNRCLTINGKSKTEFWNTNAIAQHEIIEMAFVDGKHGYALTRLQHDDRTNGLPQPPYSSYYIFALSDSGAELVKVIDSEGVPWGLAVDGLVPVLHIAKTNKDMRNLLHYELSLMPFSGVMDYGANNLEGRLAWSAAYYLNGLMSLVGPDLKSLGFSHNKVLHERLAREIGLVAKLSDSQYPNYLAKRYSVDREPMSVALHFGRILQLIARAQLLDIKASGIIQSRERICKKLSMPDGMLEKPQSLPDGSTYLFYRKGDPFWADGANVPYNYVSGVISGRLQASCITSEEAKGYLKSILQLEFNVTPLPQQWRYWWGLGDGGWTDEDDVSLNTPTYKGNGGAKAHISYRSMDIVALMLYQQRGGELPKGFENHVRQLITEGSLYPLLNEILPVKSKIENSPARRFARAIAPWELQNQVWALEALSASEKGTQSK